MTDTYDGPFSLLQMFWGSITARPLRSSLSIIAIAIQVILVLMIAGLTSGVISEWAKRVEGVGADILVQPPNSSIFTAFASAVMQESLGDQIGAQSGVDVVAPTVILTEPKHLVIVYGIDYKRFNALSKGFLFRAGRPFEGPDELIADDIIVQTRHLKLGSQVALLNHSFTLVGIVAHGKGARYFIPIRTAQEIAGAEKRVSMFYVRSKGDTEAARAQILKLMPENSIRSLSEYVTLMNSSNLPQLRPFTRSMVALGVFISFLVVLLNMHTMVMERTREIGILKALGLSRFDVVRMLLGETFILTLVGAGLGIAATFLTQAILKETNPGLTILISPAWIFSAVILATVGAAMGAAYPAFRAASYDPVVALAYE
ncbi:MAG TPA: FtsX-like permease family protein [Candidatus Udaeobacter sp.]|jgi:putative ABC transport system permease protein|nr:FtsX-like permease family protein [Candidatus Udaeobacter sp.]